MCKYRNGMECEFSGNRCLVYEKPCLDERICENNADLTVKAIREGEWNVQKQQKRNV